MHPSTEAAGSAQQGETLNRCRSFLDLGDHLERSISSLTVVQYRLHIEQASANLVEVSKVQCSVEVDRIDSNQSIVPSGYL